MGCASEWEENPEDLPGSKAHGCPPPTYQEPCPGRVPVQVLPHGHLTWVLLHQKSAFCFSALPKHCAAGTPGTKPRQDWDEEGGGGGFCHPRRWAPGWGSAGTGQRGCTGMPPAILLPNAPTPLSNPAHGSPPSSAHPQSWQPPPRQTRILRTGKNTPGAAAQSGCLEIPGADKAIIFFSFSSPPQDPGTGDTLSARRNDNPPPRSTSARASK